MPSRPSRHQTRRIATVMLFVWLFAVVASWAHACILQPERSGEHHVRSGLVAPPGLSHDANDDAGGSHMPDSHLPDPAQKACASFCDTEQSIVTKAQPAKGDGCPEPSALVALDVACWPAFTRGRAEVRWRPLAAPPPPGPPVAIAFLRLTI